MRSSHTLILLIFPGVILLSCGPSLKISTDYDRSMDFTKYRTFALYGGNKLPTISPLNQDRILHSIRNEMKGKGFGEDTLTADLLVNATAIVKNKAEISTSTNVYGYGGLARPYYWSAGMASSYTTYDVHRYKDGTLIIDVLDAGTKKLIWQGTGNSKLDKPLDQADKRIGEAINKIMEGFPPGRTGK